MTPGEMTSGGRPVVRVAVKPGDKVLTFGDLHAGMADLEAIRVVIEVAYDMGVTHVDLNGDNADCHNISKHPKDPARCQETLAAEAEELDRILTAVDGIPTLLPGGKHAKAGNHDDRTYSIVEAWPALQGMEWWHWFSGVYEKHGYDCVPRYGATQYGRVMHEHGHLSNGISRGGGKNAAAKLLDAYPAQCTVFGHCHTLDRKERVLWTNGRPVLFGTYGTGHLSDRKQHRYAGDHSFEQGAVITEFFDHRDTPAVKGRTAHFTDPRSDFQVHSLRVSRDKNDRPLIRFGGRTYR